MTSTEQLAWVGAGVIVWFAIHSVSPRVAGWILAALVIGALVKLGPSLAKVGS